MNVKSSAQKMAKLNYTDSGGSNKKKPASQPFFRPPNTPPVPPKKPADTPPKEQIRQPVFIRPTNTPPVVPKPPVPTTPPPAQQTNMWQLPPPLPLPAPQPLYNLKSPYSQPSFQLPDTANSAGENSFFSDYFDKNPSNSFLSPFPKPPAENSKQAFIPNEVLNTKVMPQKTGLGNNISSSNPFIKSTLPEKEEKNHQLYSLPPELYGKESNLAQVKAAKLRNSISSKRRQDLKNTIRPMVYGAEKLLNGLIVTPLEGLSDFVGIPLYNALSFLTSAGGPAKNTVSNFFQDAAKNIATDDISGSYSKDIDRRYSDVSEWGKLGGDISQAGGELLSLLLPSAAAANVLPAANSLVKSSSYLTKVFPHLANVMFSANSGGKAMEQAAKEGAGINQAIMHGLTAASFESLSQNLAGGIPYMSTGKLTEWLKRATDVPAVKTMIDAIGEGGEGALRTFFEPLSKKMIYNPNQPLPDGKELWSSFLQDGASSLLLKFASGQLDFKLKSQAQEYIEKGSEPVSPAPDMPEVNRAFGSSYPNSKAQREALNNAFDRAANKLYNKLENGASNPLFSQNTRSDFANAISEATNSSVFKEQLLFIEKEMGEYSQPFINGVCEDVLGELAADLANGGKSSVSLIQRKISSAFTNAVQIVQDTKKGNASNTLWLNNDADKLYEGSKNHFNFKSQQNIPWNSWNEYEKVFANGQTYAKVGERLYSHHAVDRMQPSGNRFGCNIYQGLNGMTYGRSISPNTVEYILRTVSPIKINDNNLLYKNGSIEIITNTYNNIVTIMTYKN